MRHSTTKQKTTRTTLLHRLCPNAANSFAFRNLLCFVKECLHRKSFYAWLKAKSMKHAAFETLPRKLSD